MGQTFEINLCFTVLIISGIIKLLPKPDKTYIILFCHAYVSKFL